MSTRHPVGRVRIRTHEHMRHVSDDPRFPIVHGVEPSLPDVSVSVVNEDGSETDISCGVRSVTWKVSPNGEPCVAVLEVVGAELQAHAHGVIELIPMKPEAIERGDVPAYLAPAVEAAKKR